MRVTYCTYSEADRHRCEKAGVFFLQIAVLPLAVRRCDATSMSMELATRSSAPRLPRTDSSLLSRFCRALCCLIALMGRVEGMAGHSLIFTLLYS